MSFGYAKYFGAEDPALHGGRIVGYANGLPVRGEVPPSLTDEEYDELERVCDFKCQIFRLWVDEEREQYIQIMDRVANQRFSLRDRRVREVEGQEYPAIYLEWTQIYAQAPPTRR